MKEAELPGINADIQKSRIRSRYQGVDPKLLEVIPAIPAADLYDGGARRSVAV